MRTFFCCSPAYPALPTTKCRGFQQPCLGAQAQTPILVTIACPSPPPEYAPRPSTLGGAALTSVRLLSPSPPHRHVCTPKGPSHHPPGPTGTLTCMHPTPAHHAAWLGASWGRLSFYLLLDGRWGWVCESHSCQPPYPLWSALRVGMLLETSPGWQAC